MYVCGVPVCGGVYVSLCGMCVYVVCLYVWCVCVCLSLCVVCMGLSCVCGVSVCMCVVCMCLSLCIVCVFTGITQYSLSVVDAQQLLITDDGRYR